MLGIGAGTNAMLALAQLSGAAALDVPIEEILWVLTPSTRNDMRLRLWRDNIWGWLDAQYQDRVVLTISAVLLVVLVQRRLGGCRVMKSRTLTHCLYLQRICHSLWSARLF